MSVEVGSLKTSLTLNISNFSRGMQSAIDLTKNLGKQLSQALGSVSTQGFSALRKEIEQMRESIKQLQADAAAFSATLQNTNTVLNNITALQQHTSRLRSDFAATTSETQKFQSTLSNLSSGLNKASLHAANISPNIQSASSSSADMAKNLSSSASNTSKILSQIKQIAKEFINAGKGAQNTASGTKDASGEANKLAQHLKSANSIASDLRRVVSGIVISQAFYKMLNVLESLVSSSAQFMNNMDQAQIAFTYLLGSAERASTFVQKMQDFAVDSPLSTETAMASARQLMAMGFQAESVISVMKTLTDTASVFTSTEGGISDMISRITLAIGQMKSSGHVMTQELRQLYNAGIPVFQILQEELGLTAEQIQNIGNLSIDSDTAVIALLNGLQKKYAGAAEAFTHTIPGAMSAISDSFKITAQNLFAIPFDSAKAKVNQLAEAFNNLAIITRAYGAGGFFQALIPRGLQMQLRNIIGSVQQLGYAIASVISMLSQVFSTMGAMVANVLGLILPPITTIINALASLANAVMITVTPVRYLVAAILLLTIVNTVSKLLLAFWKVIGIGKICTAVSKTILTLASSIKTLAAWTFASKTNMAIMAIVTALLLLIAASEKARAALSALFGKAFSASKAVMPSLDIGFDPKNILMPDFKQPNESAEKFDGTLGDISNSLEDIGKDADKTKKKLNQTFNQSFDEVFSVKENDAAGSGILGDLENADFSKVLDQLAELNDAVGGLDLTGDFWPDWDNIGGGVPAFDDFFGGDSKAWAESFWNQFLDMFKVPEWFGSSVGSLIGGALGSLIGHPLIGSAIGSLVGWVLGSLWGQMQESLGLSDLQGVATALQSAFLSIFKLVASSVGTLLSGGSIKAALTNGFKNGLTGAIVGVGAGFLANAISGLLKEAFELTASDMDNASFGQTILGILGTVIGTVLGGPAGSLIGNAVGQVAGSAIGALWESMSTTLQGIVAGGVSGGSLGAVVGTLVGSIGGPIGAGIGAAIGAAIGGIVGGIVEHWGEITSFFDGLWKNISSYFQQISTTASGLWDSLTASIDNFFSNISAPFEGALESLNGWLQSIYDATSQKMGEILSPITETWNSITTLINTALQDIYDLVSTIWGDIKNATTTFLNDLFLGISTVWNDIFTTVSTTMSNLKTKLSELWDLTKEAIELVLDDILSNIKTVWDNIYNHISNTVQSILNWVSTKFNEIKLAIENVLNPLLTFITDIWNLIYTTVCDIISDLLDWITQKFEEIQEAIEGPITDAWNAVSEAFTNIYETGSSKIEDLYNAVKEWIGNIYEAFTGWIDDLWTNVFDVLFGWIDDAIDKLKDFINKKNEAEDSRSSDDDDDSRSRSAPSPTNYSPFSGGPSINIPRTTPMGHASGGVFDREHWAKFAEGNKAEAIIPLDTESAMRPFAEAVADGITSRLAPILANRDSQSSENLRPLYVGTLVADERGLKELNRKMHLIDSQETTRRLT